jgi:hypothetical protein
MLETILFQLMVKKELMQHLRYLMTISIKKGFRL